MIRLKRYALFLLLMLPGAGCSLQGDPRLAGRLDPVLDRLSGGGAVVHARVVELPSRRELYATRPDQPCPPASNYKLLTSAVGLDLFGANHTVKTYLCLDGKDLWIVGTGDPATGDYRLAKAAGKTPVSMLQDWAAVLEQRGIREVNDIIYDDGAFEREPQVHPSWPKSWLQHWYAAPTTGLSFNDNSVDVTVFPAEDGKPARYEVMPPVRDIQLTNECISGQGGGPSIVKLPGGNIYRVSGTCKEKTELKSKPVENPGAFFADALRTQLAEKGIEVRGQIRRAEAPLGGACPPPTDKIVAIHETRMIDILSRINKNSQNLFAECLCKLNGQAYEARQGRQVPGSWAAGGQAVHAFLRANGIDDAALNPVDGSGLSPQNRLSARILTDMLAVMHSRPDGPAYLSSLTIAGVDGSLKDRMADLKGHVFGKTGYIGGVSSVSGYVKTRAGTWLAFSIVYNKIPDKAGDDTDVADFTKLQDEACHVLVDWQP